MNRITIIGGGITGLTAAYYLHKKLAESNIPNEITLIEAKNRLGGKIETYRKDGFTIERGPDSFLIRKQSAERLARDIGIGDKLVTNGTGKSYILVNNKLHQMPQGSFMGIPTQVKPFLYSNLFSLQGKLRAGFDFILPKCKAQEDQSLGLFFRRRFGDELVENLIEPLLSGIYAGDIDDLSLMATFPNFYQLEQKHRSLVKGLQQTMPKPNKQGKKKPSMFYSLEGGLQSLVDGLESKLDSIHVKKNTCVKKIEKSNSTYQLHLDDGTKLESDIVIVTSPFYSLKKMLGSYDFIQTYPNQKATSVANVALAFDRSAIKQDIDGTGFVVSRNSEYRITACTWTHKKWPNTTAPEDMALLRCYVGRPGDENVVEMSDEMLEKLVLHDLNKIMKIEGKPKFSVVSRWKDAMPQYSVGHKQFVDRLENELKTHLPSLYVAGSSYRGIGIPDCIDQAEQVVETIVDQMKQQQV
ncbi:protoporphyrinogen oxidase [Gracilibacillus marinus]|uniref:Coproporphyrinogen III oxidase n=1 Tax=Gracilibacillus marinus TaxID=630535 RepID=A0ABV8VYB9_9BACI